MFTDMLTIWSSSPALSLAIWLVILITLLYAGRPHAHQLLRSTGRAIHGTLRVASGSIRQLEERVINRNNDVLLAQGREEAENAIEREFVRVNTIVERDLSQYPVLHRKLTETLDKIESDYHNSIENKPLPPAWQEVMDTIKNLPSSGDPAVANILENIKEVVENSHEQTLKAYQDDTNERHGILKSMRPEWRSLNQNMQKVQQTITGLEDSAKTIDRRMDEYESMRKGENKAVNSLTSSSLTQFFISSLVLTIAAFGGIINFHLIAMPMAEMVGGNSYIGAMPTSDIAALVIIMVEITMGLFLLEALQITKLFPVIRNLDDRMRKYMGIAALTILVIFAGIESSLAYMRDLLALDREALTQSLAGAAQAESQFRWIPSIGQMMLGFILPFALAFVGIPLESFVHSLRTVLGLVALGVLRTLRVTLRLVGGFSNHLSKMLVNLYDVFIMVPLSIERMVKYRMEQASGPRQETAESDDVVSAAEEVEEAERERAAAASKSKPQSSKRKSQRQKADDGELADEDLSLTAGEA